MIFLAFPAIVLRFLAADYLKTGQRRAMQPESRLISQSPEGGAQIVIEHQLRGADATCVAVAFGTTFISWDQEMLRHCPATVATMTTERWREAE
jgi:hypothetical protein